MVFNMIQHKTFIFRKSNSFLSLFHVPLMPDSRLRFVKRARGHPTLHTSPLEGSVSCHAFGTMFLLSLAGSSVSLDTTPAPVAALPDIFEGAEAV